MDAADKTDILTLKTGERLSYFHRKSKQNSDKPGVMFIHGYQSDMTGDKALRAQALCEKLDRNFTRFDLFGHGQSSGSIEDGTIGHWKEDALAMLDEVAKGPQILVGSSLGGWISLLTALARPSQVVGFVGIAAAPDFTRYLVKEQLTEEQKQTLSRDGKLVIEENGFTYIFSEKFLAEAEDHCLLEGQIAVNVPVRLLHGIQDDAVPYQVSLQIMEKLASDDTEVTLVKAGGHRLSNPDELALLERTLASLL